jgi:uncharacterized repeat protein (TIGR04076 family)
MSEDETFELYDLRVTIEEIRGTCTCGHAVGDVFELQGGRLSLPTGKSFCVYALQSTLPLLPAKQRPLQPAVVCPDPLCGVVMRIDRTAQRRLRHSDTSATPWQW